MIKVSTAKAWSKPVLAPIGVIADVAGKQGTPPVQNAAKS